MHKGKQVDESCELITNAFLMLLAKKTFDEITLTEIANTAGVARMTLYRHFKTKEDILKYRGETIAAIFKTKMEENSVSIEEFISTFFILYKNLPLRYLIATDEQINSIFSPYILEIINQLYLFLKNQGFTNIDEYTFNFLVGGMRRLLKDWCDNDFKEDSMYITKKIMPFVYSLK